MGADRRLTYDGTRVIVAGAGGSGMGASVARLVSGMGAEVLVLDVRKPEVDGVAFERTDLSDNEAIDAAVDRWGGPVNALFNCQGVSGAAPGTTSDAVMRVNFLGIRHLTERVLPLMPAGAAVASIASAGGLGWPRRLDTIRELLTTADFSDGVRWVEGQADDLLKDAFPNAYAFSKQALIVWTMQRAVTAIEDGIRINCSSPGSTRTAMATDFPDAGVEYMNRPSGRESTPDEQAWPLAFLNSPQASYVNGVNLVIDGGNAAARTMGMLR